MCPQFRLMFLCFLTFERLKSNSCIPRLIAAQYNRNQLATDCGVRSSRYVATRSIGSSQSWRKSKIISGSYSKEGQFPWQASLELLHPSLGFLGHWCGAVLIHQYWVLSAAHCVHNDLFNLPLPPLWTVVLGEYNRAIESGYEQRIPIEKIVLHQKYENFLHDLVLMKLSIPANLSKKSNIRRICLPVLYNQPIKLYDDDDASDGSDYMLEGGAPDSSLDLLAIPDKMENFLRSAQLKQRHPNITLPTMKQLMDLKILNRLKRVNQLQKSHKHRLNNDDRKRHNDKFMNLEQNESFNEYQKYSRYVDTTRHMPYIDCIATGWGKANISGDLTDLLLKTTVPLHNNRRCREAYGSFVRIHRGHLCAGKLNGQGGTCVGDSGGPLQCRLTKDGPWILAGITSFGSGCAIEGYPDVYVRTSHYMKWIQDTIAYA